MATEGQRPWHRLFGLSWMDFFQGMPVTVEMEKDLSLRRQLLDLLIFRKEAAYLPCRLPDGFEELAAHNLVSFKSYQESLDGWALSELIGHYVNYRKQVSESMNDLLAEDAFRLFAVSVRYPQGLAREGWLRPEGQGVYQVRHYTGSLRVVVVHQLPQEPHNAMLHLFSAQADLLRYGATHYRQRSGETSTLLYQLLERYREEGPLMPDQLDQFVRETVEAMLQKLPAEELRKRLSPEERLEGLPAEELRKRLSPEERLEGLVADEMLAALSPEAREALRRQLKENDSPPEPA